MQTDIKNILPIQIQSCFFELLSIKEIKRKKTMVSKSVPIVKKKILEDKDGKVAKKSAS